MGAGTELAAYTHPSLPDALRTSWKGLREFGSWEEASNANTHVFTCLTRLDLASSTSPRSSLKVAAMTRTLAITIVEVDCSA